MAFNVIVILGAIILPNFGSILINYVIHRKASTQLWYKGLYKPKWMLPKWVNRPLWLILYSCMGLASYLVFKAEGGIDGELEIEMVIYAIQLICNWVWPLIFFGRNSVLLGFVFIIPYALSVYFCSYVFYLSSYTAFALMMPYALWTTYTVLLVALIFRKNFSRTNEMIMVNI